MDRDFLRDRSVLVMGLGRFGGGLDVARFACRAGARVTVTDLASTEALAGTLAQLADCPIDYHLGGHREEDFGPDGADVVVVNPAVPPDNRYLAIARAAGKPITSQVELFFELCPACIVGITGSNGKSTTTLLTAHILRAGLQSDPREVWLGGNIGNEMWLSEVEHIQPEDVAVLELSSFQIEQLARIRRGPHIAVITNLTPNHLDRHGTFEAYCDAKENLFRHQPLDAERPCVSIFNADDPVTCSWYERYRRQPGRRCRLFSPDEVGPELAEHFTLPGRANRANLAAAMQVAEALEVPRDRLGAAIASFRGLPHRLELVREINGIRWYDDSKATTTPSAIAALEAFSCPRIVIAGGYDKHVPFDDFAAALVRGAKAVVLIGATAPKIAEAIRPRDPEGRLIVQFADGLPQAVAACADLAEAGDVVLLSTACASYDMFDNYEHRAAVFRAEVDKLARTAPATPSEPVSH